MAVAPVAVRAVVNAHRSDSTRQAAVVGRDAIRGASGTGGGGARRIPHTGGGIRPRAEFPPGDGRRGRGPDGPICQSSDRMIVRWDDLAWSYGMSRSYRPPHRQRPRRKHQEAHRLHAGRTACSSVQPRRERTDMRDTLADGHRRQLRALVGQRRAGLNPQAPLRAVPR